MSKGAKSPRLELGAIFHNIVKPLLEKQNVEQIPLENLAIEIQKELDHSSVGDNLNPEIKSEYDLWSNPEFENNDQLWTAAQGTLIGILNVYLQDEKYQEYAAYLKAPDGLLFKCLVPNSHGLSFANLKLFYF
jgi:hypothetical protein